MPVPSQLLTERSLPQVLFLLVLSPVPQTLSALSPSHPLPRRPAGCADTSSGREALLCWPLQAAFALSSLDMGGSRPWPPLLFGSGQASGSLRLWVLQPEAGLDRASTGAQTL